MHLAGACVVRRGESQAAAPGSTAHRLAVLWVIERRMLKRIWTRLGLWPRIALALSVGLLVLFVAFGALDQYALRGAEQQTRHEYLVVAEVTGHRVDGLLSQTEVTLQELGQEANVMSPSPSPATSTIQRLLDFRLQRTPLPTLGLFIVNGSARVVASAGTSSPQTGADASTFPSVLTAIQQGRPRISNPFLDPATGRPSIAISVPIGGGASETSTVVGVFPLDSAPMMNALDQAVSLARTGHAVLIDQEGLVLVSTLGLPFLSKGGHPAFFQHAMAVGTDTVGIAPFESTAPGETEGEDHLMAVAMLRQVPWGVAVGGDASEAFASLNRLSRGLAALGGIALLVVWGASLWGARLIVRPVTTLMAAAQRIANGDLALPLTTQVGGEIGAMAAALEQMRQRLLEMIASLEDLSATLEARVRDRTEELRRQETQVRQLLHRVITAQEDERRRIAYELHDEIGQTLTAVRLSLDRLGASAEGRQGQTDRVAQIEKLVDEAMGDLRRLISGLRPRAIDQLGLMPALRGIVQETLAPLGIAVTLEGPTGERLAPEIEVVLFRICQEAVHNIARHSGADTVDIRVVRAERQVRMKIRDNGHGFDVAEVEERTTTGRGLGLAGMHERASLLGGSVEIQSVVGEGTTIEVTVPLPGVTGRGAEDESGEKLE